ncbi:site-specific integrase [Microbacterium hominis]|uniref:tyrosine-type recombinase/integrase n=1 Tax=Microbacterium TaxID=33882 RepID=UPI00168A468A|nr:MULTISPECIES: site-specific integrase [Microbacterium]QOC24799.1 site-specific integrase [Microbacterium hominis]QOC28853.1 site-specific integrase [Microbacterium hominis]QYF98946.1 site-specific integrase [Microbacterium sp. PAMC21962]
MARAWITDRWVKDAIVELPDGSKTRLSATSAQLRSLKTLPEHFRTSKFGRGSRWIAAWYEIGGRQRQRLFERRSDAEAFIAALEDDIRSDRYIDPAERERAFRVVAEEWLASKKRVKESSWRRYRRELDMYVLPRWGDSPIGAITRPQIDAWVAQLQTGDAPYVFDVNEYLKKPRTPRAMAPAYMRNVVGATFGGVMRYAVAEQLIGRNPLERVELPRIEGDLEADLPSLSYPDIEALAEEAQRSTGRVVDGDLLRLLAYAGPRIGEATALKVRDLDAGANRVRVHRTWTLDREGRRKLGPVKTWEKRWVPVPAFLVKRLQDLIEGRDEDEFLFTGMLAAAIDGGNWRQRVWYRAVKDAGLAAGMSVHDLRHVAASNAIAAGADVKLVQQMLGHKDATETLNTYAHLWPERTGEVMAAVEKRRAEALRKSAAA